MAENEWVILNKNKTLTSFNQDKEKIWSGSFYFIQGADCQFGLIQRYIEKNPIPGWEKEIILTKLAVERVNALNPKPRFFVICGDLCDAFYAKEPELRAQQEQDFKEIFSNLDPEIPLVCVCGNHDVGDHPTVLDIEKYRSSFGDDYFSFWCGGVFCLVVNSQYWFDSRSVAELAAEQDIWLEKQLADLQQAQRLGSPAFALVFQHIPWFLEDPQEPAHPYFTLSPLVRQRWLPKLHAAGVKAAFCGHYHRNAKGWYKDMEVVTTSAIGGQLGDDQSGLRVVRVHEHGIEHSYHNLSEKIPSNIELLY